jgi:predicted GH43/DUF377 family glycosyl hydrolase
MEMKNKLNSSLDVDPPHKFVFTLERNPHQPILEEQPELDWANRKVYNPCVFRTGNIVHMFFRAVGIRDNVSRLGYATSMDGVNFSVQEKPFLEPEGNLEVLGVEDPRFTVMDKPIKLAGKKFDIFGSYTGVKPWTAQIKLIAMSRDLSTLSERYLMLPEWDMDKPAKDRDLWNTPEGRPLIFPGFDPAKWDQKAYGNWTKAAGIFPKRINGLYWALWGEYKIRAATSEDLIHWDVISKPVLSQREGMFDQAYLEMGPPPFFTKYGWIVFYNGINSLGQEGRVYGVGWAILDRDNPTKVIDRSETPILLPETEDEITGEIDIALINGKTVRELTSEEFARHKDKIPMAVFCNGALQHSDNNFDLYYGAGDKRIKRAVVELGVR